MTRIVKPVTTAGRADRILDAAAELLVAHGYRRVTVDEVARRAGIGKGTVYLHFATKEQLFLTAVLRSQSRWTARFLEEVRADPSAVLLSAMARSVFLAVHEDPVLRAVVLSDLDTLGALARIAAETVKDLMDERQRTLDDAFRVLRELGLVAADRPIPAQKYAYAAIVTGFLAIEPMMPQGPSLAENADMLAHVVRSAFEPYRDEEGIRAAAPRVAALYQSLLERLNQEIP